MCGLSMTIQHVSCAVTTTTWRLHLNRCSRGRSQKTQGRVLTLNVTSFVNDQSVRVTRDENDDPPADCRWMHVTRSMTREHRGRRTIATVVIMIRTK